MKPHTIEEAIEAFDNDALLKMMLHQLVETFPSFADAPPRVRATRDRLMRMVRAAPDLYEVVLVASTWLEGKIDLDKADRAVLRNRARAALAKARGEA